MKTKTRYRIMVMLRLDIMPGRQELIGIFRYMKRKGLNWNVQIRSPAEIRPDTFKGASAPDGVITAESQIVGAAESLVASKIPIVSLDVPPEIFARRKKNIVFIRTDNAAIGRMAAAHLESKGRFMSCAFVPDSHRRPWSIERERAFAAAVGKAGFTCVSMTEKDEGNLPGWIAALPKPAAVMVACDRRAVQVLEACQAANVEVPGQLSLVSVDNDEMYCEFGSPTVSSIDPDFENEGYLAAAELDRLLKSQTPCSAKTMISQVRKVVERESTSPVSPAAHLVRKALDFISRNACRGIGVEDVVEELGVSRRLADLRFRQFHGQTILETISERRFTKVKRLLMNTRLPIAAIAANSGFGGPKHLAVAFRKRFGMTMREFRARH
ncbi:MAG: substrate-binding domain-containing protein [Kiritimatiellae bacterium]|nr:substrate-binding domain-containing protein [Kiritimatiellia bacterium]